MPGLFLDKMVAHKLILSHSPAWAQTFCSKWKFGCRFCVPVDILYYFAVFWHSWHSFSILYPLKNPKPCFSSFAICLGSPVLNLNNSLVMHMKAEDRKYDNKYAQQLQADYQSLTLSSSCFFSWACNLQSEMDVLVHWTWKRIFRCFRIDNINDASKKCNDLRARLFKMDWYADKFDALPSGVWNKIDAQSWS